MTWNEFPWFATASILLWTAGAASALLSKKSFSTVAAWLTATGLCVFAAFIALFWTGLQRPPLRTMGETRLWYSLFLMLAGLLTYCRWHHRWLLLFTTVLSSVFCFINIFRPEIHDRTLVPALQSPFFIPHVTVYMFAYGILACAFLLAVAALVRRGHDYLESVDNLVYIGTGLLFTGMLTGSIWAKQAWGDWWTWDPKETWAMATWLSYLLYLHLRPLSGPSGAGTDAGPGRKPVVSHDILFALLVFSFLLLQMCWYGINYLPAAQGISIHTY